MSEEQEELNRLSYKNLMNESDPFIENDDCDEKEKFCDDLISALMELQEMESCYRLAHDLHGDGSQAAGYYWDHMRKSGDRARTLLGLDKSGE